MPRSVLVGTLLLASVAVADAQTARDVTYTPRAVVHVNAKLRFTTVIALPDGEQILDFVCGDKEFWVVSGAENLAYIKPAKAGAQTNLTLVTARGTIYSFLLAEGAPDYDLAVYVAPADATANASSTEQRFYSAADVAAIRAVAEQAKEEASAATRAASNAIEDGITRFRASYPTELQFPYRFKANESPFRVSAIFHDGRFTYIRAAATELPALYEVLDGTPNLVHFQVEHGTYVIPKVVERGYLAIGKQTWRFESAAR